MVQIFELSFLETITPVTVGNYSPSRVLAGKNYGFFVNGKIVKVINYYLSNITGKDFTTIIDGNNIAVYNIRFEK